MSQIPIRELMTCDVLSLVPEASLDTALQKMCEYRRSSIVIVEGSRPVGIITERDMVNILAHSDQRAAASSLLVSEIMSSPPVCINQGASLYEALVITQARRIRHLPVVDQEDKLVGMLSQGDIARAHFHAIEQQREIIEQQIQQRTFELVEANEELKALSLQDALMGIGNRRAMEVDIQFTHSNARRYQRPYCVALLDVDFFKKYNDHYGHQAGDEALKKLAKCAQKAIRASDRLYRYGGEELLLLLPETHIEDAVAVVERVLSSLEEEDIEHCESAFGHLTVSAGISAVVRMENNDGLQWQSVIAEADKKLYQAKNNGRNQVCWQLAETPLES